MKKLKKFIKKNVSALLMHSGIISVEQLTQKSMILGYHRVLPEGSEIIEFIQPGMFVTTKTFEKHLQFLSGHFNMVKLSEFTPGEGPLSQSVITFDDGWFDNFEYALPLLRQYKVPATIFLSTRFIGTNDWPWSDKLSYIFYKGDENLRDEVLRILSSYLKTEAEQILNIAQVRPVKLAADMTIEYSKKLSWENLQSLISEIETMATEVLEELQYLKSWLSWENIKEMEMSGIEFASHTHNHIILNNENIDKIDDELKISLNILRQQLKTFPPLFSYPNGEFTDLLVKKLKNLGISKAVTTYPDYVEHTNNPLLLPRFLLHNDISDSIPEFVNVLSKSLIYR